MPCHGLLILVRKEPGAREESQQPRVLLEVEVPLINRKIIMHLLFPGEWLFQPADG